MSDDRMGGLTAGLRLRSHGSTRTLRCRDEGRIRWDRRLSVGKWLPGTEAALSTRWRPDAYAGRFWRLQCVKWHVYVGKATQAADWPVEKTDGPVARRDASRHRSVRALPCDRSRRLIGSLIAALLLALLFSTIVAVAAVSPLPHTGRAGGAGSVSPLPRSGEPVGLSAPQSRETNPHGLGVRVAPLRGTVVDGTTGRPVAGLAVTVQALVGQGGQPRVVARGTTDGRGRFALSVAPTSGAVGYGLTAAYRGVQYVAPARPGQNASVQLAVYDTIARDTNLLAPKVTVGMRRVGRGLAVIEEWTIVNVGNTTVVGSDVRTGRDAATIPLPRGASDVRIQSVEVGAMARVQGGGVALDEVIRPATGNNPQSYHQLTFSYSLPGSARGHPTLPISSRYAIGNLYVFTIGARLVAPGFASTTLDLGARRITAYVRSNLSGDSTAWVGVDGPPAIPASAPAAPATVPITVLPSSFPAAGATVMAVLGFGLLLALGLFSRARGVPTLEAGGTGTGDRRALQREYARLLVAIAELDLQRERGRVAPSTYERRRSREKSRLLVLSRRLDR